MSAIASVAAIRVDDTPCCIEILVAGIDRSTPDHEAVPGMPAMADDDGLVVLDLDEAQALHAKLEVAIRALETSEPAEGPG